jgi:glycosyltransferase involved in cell wall biosynthesis
VTLFATGDSSTRAHLEAMAPRALRDAPGVSDPLAPHIHMLGTVYRRAKEFDLIHCHTGYLGLPLAEYVHTPTVTTLHGRLDLPEAASCYGLCSSSALISISDAQRAPLRDIPFFATVHHGVPPRLYPFRERSDGYLLFVGRISPEKGVDSAVRVARHAGLPLHVAAKVDAVDRVYYESTIRPLFDSTPSVEFLGEVEDRAKAELMGGASALIFPIDWPEPFGLVMIEALACGTPVIARRRGSVPEILRDGETGFICGTESEMVRAVERLPTIDRRRCRQEFEARFTDRAMAEHYVDAYQRLFARKAAVRLARGTTSAVDAASSA